MEQQIGPDGQVTVMQAVPTNGGAQQVQVLQVNQAGQMITGNSGQQIMVHALPQNGQIQVQGNQTLQQIQVVPVSSLGVRIK